jgi:Tat protein translocase TatB subunit
MFDIGFQELIIIFVVALLVVGPNKLPEVAKMIGKWMREIRKGIDIAKMQLESEIKAIEPKAEGDVSNLFRDINPEAVSPDLEVTERETAEDATAGTRNLG